MLQRRVRQIGFQTSDGRTDAAGLLRKKLEWGLVSTKNVCDLTQMQLPPVLILSEIEDTTIQVDALNFDAQISICVYKGKVTRGLSRPALDRFEYRIENDGWIVTLCT